MDPKKKTKALFPASTSCFHRHRGSVATASGGGTCAFSFSRERGLVKEVFLKAWSSTRLHYVDNAVVDNAVCYEMLTHLSYLLETFLALGAEETRFVNLSKGSACDRRATLEVRLRR